MRVGSGCVKIQQETNMANPNIENETLAKGVRLTVIVEYSFENLIAVFLFHNGKEFRGVLLENDTGYEIKVLNDSVYQGIDLV